MGKQYVHVWPTKGTHMHVLWVISNELNALQTCIWLKTDSIAFQKICNILSRVVLLLLEYCVAAVACVFPPVLCPCQ